MLLTIGPVLCQELEPPSATRSVFPAIEALLGESRYQAALQYVGRRKNMGLYRDMVDFLFCELFPEWREACQQFYDEQGPPLRKLLSRAQRKPFLPLLHAALERALQAHEAQERLSWTTFRREVTKAA